MLKKSLQIATTIFFVSSLTACMNLGHLTYKQAHMLKKQGFSLTDEGWTLALPEHLIFEFNDYQVNPQQVDKINLLAKQLQKYDLDKVKFIGHTDNIGQATYNKQLSEKRAQTVANLFIEQGYQSKNLQIVGRGADQPLVPNDTYENRATNRRVNITIIP